MKPIFYLDDSPLDDYTLVKINTSLINFKKMLGSWSVVGARLCNLDYPSYLRMCRDKYNATLIGRNSLYPTVAFKDKNDARHLMNFLNSRIKDI